MNISEKGISLIKKFEGLVLKAYRDIVGVWTIGYGHTLGVKEGDTVNEAGAEALLKSDLAHFENKLNRLLRETAVTLTQNQYDALICFIFNVGWGAFVKSTMLKKLYVMSLNEPSSVHAVAEQFNRWIYARGKPVSGLINRRAAERNLFLSND